MNIITPSPELVQQWFTDWDNTQNDNCYRDYESHIYVATRAAQYGADLELEACCALLKQKGVPAWSLLRAARRPRPPSLKEQALQALSEAVKMADDVPPEGICSGQADIIRRALEQIDD